MIIRTYRCDDCGEVFDVTCESNDGDPDCPQCSKVLVWQPERFAIGGSNIGKAADVTQRIIENDFGLSNFNDSMREGDVAYKEPVRARDEREVIERVQADAAALAATPAQLVPQVQQFWSGAHPAQLNVAAAALADAKANAKGNSRNMDLLMSAGKRGEAALDYRFLTETGRTIRVRR
jgi:hypothetical protein